MRLLRKQISPWTARTAFSMRRCSSHNYFRTVIKGCFVLPSFQEAICTSWYALPRTVFQRVKGGSGNVCTFPSCCDVVSFRFLTLVFFFLLDYAATLLPLPFFYLIMSSLLFPHLLFLYALTIVLLLCDCRNLGRRCSTWCLLLVWLFYYTTGKLDRSELLTWTW